MPRPFPSVGLIRERYDAVIIDLDGTLLDSMDLWNRVDMAFLESRGFRVTPDYTDYVKRTTIREAAEYTVRRFGLPESADDVINEWNSMVSHAYATEIRCKDGADTYVKQLKDAGIRLGVATALVRDNVDAVLASNRLSNIWDAVLTLDDLGGMVNKSEPEIYLKTASLLGSEPARTLVYEDVPEAADGARLGGFATCAVYDRIGCGRVWDAFAGECDYAVRHWRQD